MDLCWLELSKIVQTKTTLKSIENINEKQMSRRKEFQIS